LKTELNIENQLYSFIVGGFFLLSTISCLL